MMVGLSFDVASQVELPVSAMNASLKSESTYSGNSSVRKRKLNERQDALFGTRRSTRKISVSRVPRTNGPPLPRLRSPSLFLRAASRASPELKIAYDLPLRGNEPSLVVDIAAGRPPGGISEKRPRTTCFGLTAMAFASFVAPLRNCESTLGSAEIFAFAGTAVAPVIATAVIAAAPAHRAPFIESPSRRFPDGALLPEPSARDRSRFGQRPREATRVPRETHRVCKRRSFQSCVR